MYLCTRNVIVCIPMSFISTIYWENIGIVITWKRLNFLILATIRKKSTFDRRTTTEPYALLWPTWQVTWQHYGPEQKKNTAKISNSLPLELGSD